MDILKSLQREFTLRVLEEGFARIRHCCSLLSEEDIWLKPNENVNSIGNLILHLEGNVRQYIISGLGGQSDTRNRDQEFANTQRIESGVLLKGLEKTIKQSCEVIDLTKEEDVIKEIRVQGFKMNGVSIIVHVIEHFSYHVGQITSLTKLYKNVDTGYYKGIDLNAKS